jgi:glycosyltransferase involved in cell wall biosynthesis
MINKSYKNVDYDRTKIMKVCIISTHFLETTFPLAKHLADKNLDVSVFCLLPIEDRNSHVIDFSKYNVKIGFDPRYDKIVYNNRLKVYLKNVHRYSFFFSNIKKDPLINIIIFFRLILKIKALDFDIIHLVGSAPIFPILHIFFKNRIIHSMHETTTHESNRALSLNQKFILNILCRRNVQIIFHSKSVKNAFLYFFSRYKGFKYCIKNRINVIPFGLFETYNCYDICKNNFKEEKNTILFFGKILPYKGLKYLIKAVRYLNRKNNLDLKLIIAGSGELNYKKKQNDNIEIINRFIKNEEINCLIKRSVIVVCPYTSASQSGIPMVSFLYKKPVIATAVGGFCEIIENMKTGILVPPKDKINLARAIELMLNDEELRTKIKYNIHKKFNYGKFSWESIAEETIKIYQHKLNYN